MSDPATVKRIETVARRLREHAIRMVHASRASHLGSCLSAADIMAALYWSAMQIDPERPAWPDRDHFILSKGHAAAVLYATLAERGFIPVSELESYCRPGSRLTGHATSGVPGVEISSGSLGHGLPVGCGLALAAKRDHSPSRTFVLLSDGELDEGSNWEAFLFGSHHRLDNLTAIVDYNKIQSFGRVEDVLALEPLADKFRAFGWSVVEVNGHEIGELISTFQSLPLSTGKPSVVIAHTVKGKGVSFMENDLAWHYKSPNGDEVLLAMEELGEGE